jgi:hypothetical protein
VVETTHGHDVGALSILLERKFNMSKYDEYAEKFCKSNKNSEHILQEIALR